MSSYLSTLLQTVNPPKAFVYVQNGTVYAIDQYGNNITAPITAGTDDAPSIQAAINSLTSGRTWKESVYLRGSFVIGTQITIPSYTVIRADAYLKTKNSTNISMITNTVRNATPASQNRAIDIIGGEYDGNKSNQSGTKPVIDWQTIQSLTMQNTYVHDGTTDSVSCAGIHNSAFINNRFENSTQVGIRVTTNSTFGDTTDRVLVVGNRCHSNGINGIWFQGDGSGSPARTTTDCAAVGNSCNSNSNSGIYVDWYAYGITITGNTCEGNQTGIFTNGQANGTPFYNGKEMVISGNACRANTQNGIVATYVGHATFVGNLCVENQFHGISVLGSKRVHIIGNTCFNNSQAGAGTYDGIVLFGNASSNTQLCYVSGNKCFDDQGTPTQKYGIEEQATYTNDNVFTNNDLRENQTGGLSLNGTNSIANGNMISSLVRDMYYDVSNNLYVANDKAGPVIVETDNASGAGHPTQRAIFNNGGAQGASGFSLFEPLNFDQNIAMTGTSSKTQSFSDSQNGNYIHNVPTGKGHFFRVNGSNLFVVNAASGNFATPLSFSSGINIVAKSAAAAPTTTDIPSSQWILWKNTNDGTVKLYYNDAGTLKSVALA